VKKILIIEDELSMRLGLAYTLEAAGYVVIAAERGDEGIGLIGKQRFDVVVTDMRLPGADGMEVLKAVRKAQPNTGVVVITGYADVQTAVEAMKLGAFDYIAKPFEPAHLLALVERFLCQAAHGEDSQRLREEVAEHQRFEEIVSNSPSMLSVFNLIQMAAKTDSSVIVFGESGTGKELVANAVHNRSPRRDKPFIKVNCAAIPENLLEAELCGYEKGAFTGALQRKKGKLEVADGGTFFFDEIGDMSFSLQAKLLRVLEGRSFERVGGTEPVHVDIRFIFATMRRLPEEIRKGKFREDLYYRINVLPITLPPLRERADDIPLLLHFFVAHFCRKQGRQVLDFAPEAMDLLRSYPYPGNVRELKHAVEMAVTFCSDRLITPSCLPGEIRESTPAVQGAWGDAGELERRRKETERQTIINILKKTGGRKMAAAKALGISRETLWRKLKEYNIDADAIDMDIE
jgi:DNA-binding NtrC family response regulator